MLERQGLSLDCKMRSLSSFPWLQVKELKGEENEDEKEEEEVEGGLGFDDPFFQHDVAMATTVSGISSHAKLIYCQCCHF